MDFIKFDASEADSEIIEKIVDRAAELEESVDKMQLEMSITACHLNGCPLRLQDLLEADNFNFGHDVFGIHNHISRENAQLQNCFLPRFSA